MYLYARDAEVASDAVAEAFAQALRRGDALRSPATWVWTVAFRLAEGLLRRGIHVHPIIYPAVSETMARLRFFVTAAHSGEQLRFTADALAEELAKLSLLPKKIEAHATLEVPAARDAS